MLATLRRRAAGRWRTRSRCPTVFPPSPDLRQAHDRRHSATIIFAEHDSDDPNEQFTINGQFYDHNRIDTTVTLGDDRGVDDPEHVEGAARLPHPPDRLPGDVEINGEPQPFTGYQDTVSLPFATKKKGQLVPGEVKVIIPFTNPVIVGEFVYHCHIVQHADQGMMANIEVVAP